MREPDAAVIGSSTLTLAMLCMVPIWNAVELLQDINYCFWFGISFPLVMITLYVATIVMFAFCISARLRKSQGQEQSDVGIMSLCLKFIGLLGFLLLLISVILSDRVDSTVQALSTCSVSASIDFKGQEEDLKRLYDFWQVLSNIRSQPYCSYLPTVEECVGFSEAYPYTTFIQDVEDSYKCSGFCGISKQALFGVNNYQATCDSSLARDMTLLAGDIAHQTFLEGAALLLIAVVTASLMFISRICPKAGSA